jgi:hypothetical protein
MYNSINFFNNTMTWCTQTEADTMSADLLAGKPFVSLPRLQKTYNSASIHDIGVNSVFSDPLVAGGEFKFSRTGIWAKNNGIEYVWNKGWMSGRGTWDTCDGMSFDDFIASTILPQ